jgi:FSR family fosmidomycin resistance protein-like MFS transporter
MSDDTSSHRGLLAWFSMGHLANDWAPSTIWIIAPAIAITMDLSPAEVGLLITITHFGAALGYLPAGLLLATFWWVAIGYLAASFAPGFWTLALMLAVAGLGDAAWHPIATGILAQSLPKRRAHALGIHAMTGTFAEVLAPLSIGFLLVWFDWRVALQISTIPAILMGIAFFRVAGAIPSSPQHAISLADLRALWNLWRVPRGLAVIGMVSVYNMALLAVLSMAPLFLQQVYGLTLAQTGAAFSAMVLAGALVQPIIGRLSDTVGRKPVFIVGTVAAVLACMAVALSTTLAVAVLALMAAVAALYGIRSSVLASAVEFGEQREATTLGLAFMLLDGVGALGAALAGVAGSLDLHYAFVLAAGMAGIAAVVAVPIMRK